MWRTRIDHCSIDKIQSLQWYNYFDKFFVAFHTHLYCTHSCWWKLKANYENHSNVLRTIQWYTFWITTVLFVIEYDHASLVFIFVYFLILYIFKVMCSFGPKWLKTNSYCLIATKLPLWMFLSSWQIKYNWQY